jgi:hypothetical protein
MMMLISGMNLYAQDSDAPDMALLEFIGEGVKVDNDVVDPISWQSMEDMTGSNQNKQQQSQQTQDGSRQVNRQQSNE